MTQPTLTEQIEGMDWTDGGQDLMAQLMKNANAGSEVGLATVTAAATLFALEFPGQSFADTAALHARLEEFADLVFAIRSAFPTLVETALKAQLVGGADAG